MKYWLGIAIGAVLSFVVLWLTSLPLGIPGEWTWERARIAPDFAWNLFGGIVAAAIYLGVVRQGWLRLTTSTSRPWFGVEKSIWLLVLVVLSFGWIWIVQEVSPERNRLGKCPFVLYYPSSSGYFTKARYEDRSASHLLEGYEELMRQGDVLHTGTHPPGLFLAFQGMIALCESSPELSNFLEQTQPPSFREACDVVALNGRRRPNHRVLMPLDRQVLWLATLLVLASAALVPLPLYGLLRRSCTVGSSWVGASIWPALPAVAMFVPKSDAVFPLIGLTIVWLWLLAWDHRSLIAAFFAGVVVWIGLVCSLAFLPVLLFTALVTFGPVWLGSNKLRSATPDLNPSSAIESNSMNNPIGVRRIFCVVIAAIGFTIPTYLIWRYTNCNLINVWWMNYQNHAGFYVKYPRTYWKWLLANPLELTLAAGWPVIFTAIVASWHYSRRVPVPNERNATTNRTVVYSMIFVWGLLWITGKNSGEAARLWLLFLPWLVWTGTVWWASIQDSSTALKRNERRWLSFLAIQLCICLLTVARVAGFLQDLN